MFAVSPRRRPAVVGGALALAALLGGCALALALRPGAPLGRPEPRPGKHAIASALDRLPPLPKKRVKNVIVMIGDGMGYNQVAAADLYRHGKLTGGVYADFPVQLAMSTYPAGGSYDPAKAWTDFGYVKQDPTDSAAAGTALATGSKTSLGTVGEDASGKRLRNAIEAADRAGKATGVVTTVPFAHATPASFTAHDSSRRDIGAIAAEMLASTVLDVICGAGHPLYDDGGRKVTQPRPRSYDYVGGQDTWEKLVAGKMGGAEPYAFVETRAQVQKLASGETPKRVVIVPQVFMTLQERRPGSRRAKPYEVPQTKTIPTLAEETRAALNVLDEDADGFLLMVEGGAIDWASHANESGRVIEEQEQFDESVAAVFEWVEANSDWSETLLIVTADHETGYLTGPKGPAASKDDTGAYLTLEPTEALELPGMKWNTVSHTNSLVPLWANGAHARLLLEKPDGVDPVRGDYVDNTTVGRAIFTALHAEQNPR